MIGATVPDGAAAVAERDVDCAGGDQKLRDSGCRRARAVEHDTHFGELLAHKLQGVEKSGKRDDGGAVLVIVEDGNIAALLESAFDLKAAGRGDVLQIHAAEAAREQAHGVHDLIHVLAAYTQRDRVHIAESLEEDALAFHDGHARLGADVAETEDRSAVGDDRDGVPTARELIALVHVLLDLETRCGDAGRIGKAQGLGGVDRGAVNHFQLALPFIVQAQRFFRVIHNGLQIIKIFLFRDPRLSLEAGITS